MKTPLSTYRIQFHQNFTFKEFQKQLPYLHELGVDTIYASPIFKAVPGSRHGYDVTDFHTINPELGTLQELRKISKSLKKLGMKWLQDIVPNHMAFHSDNWRLMDVLMNGKNSAYVSYFDTSFSSTLMEGKLQIPVLGKSLNECIQSNDLQIVDIKNKSFIQYFENTFPLRGASTKSSVNANQLKAILAKQYYELVPWQHTDKKVTYRRFFTVNGLICLNMQDEVVFNDYHQLIFQLLDEKVFDGIRIDHIDGLYDPDEYLKRLRKKAGNCYIVAEKILEKDEILPSWPISGTTGYEFLAQVNQVFTATENKEKFKAIYEHFFCGNLDFNDSKTAKKSLILQRYMQGELNNLTDYFIKLGLSEDADREALKQEIAAFLVHFKVYRFYFSTFPLSQEVNDSFHVLLEEISKLNNNNYQYIKDMLNKAQYGSEKSYQTKAAAFFKRCLQFTGPLMAKGIEDTLMYTYHLLIAHNEVGDCPNQFGISPDHFHHLMTYRAKHWPLALNTTSTHDTKRGEDVRARLNVLSRYPEKWKAAVQRWENLMDEEIAFPEVNDRYFIYQNLIGAYPVFEAEQEKFHERFKEYIVKALREGKVSSDWSQPNEAYELKCLNWITYLLDFKTAFNRDFAAFLGSLTDEAMMMGMAQLTLKFTCPGVPDIYQGTELWDLSLVDPDNRRAVNYELRKKFLHQQQSLLNLWKFRHNGAVKLKLLNQLLELRKSHAELLSHGSYKKVKIKGTYKKYLIAFERQFKNERLLIVVPLRFPQSENGLLNTDWKDTALKLDTTNLRLQNLLTEHSFPINDLFLNSLFQEFPISVVQLEKINPQRRAGVVLPVASLPSSTYMGDFGPGARWFIDFLSASHQHFWQVLPLNPVSAEQFYSPYSSESSMAINPLMLHLEMPEEKNQKGSENPMPGNEIDYEKEEKLKSSFFKQLNIDSDNRFFRDFCEAEKHWLDNYALFQEIKKQQHGKPWYEWPQKLKMREKKALLLFEKRNITLLERHKWLQFLAHQQWLELKNYANKKGISLIGDLPFYVGYDSADIWANPLLFSLNKSYEVEEMAGVPPDYFNANGQLWGMPVYRWEAHYAENFEWWIQRIARNLQLYDCLRLDHFRAFESYWAVPHGARSAASGQWKKGPGTDFLDLLSRKFPQMPFIAEDLGDVNLAVFNLRDRFNLPGMKVLQFAFGNDMPSSEHIPHQFTVNHVVYTGTHDNNTILGWFRQDAGKQVKRNLSAYLNRKVKSGQVAAQMIRLAYSSVANIAIIPIQDFLNLDESARINIPSSTQNNWKWRLQEKQLSKKAANKVKKLTIFYNR